METGTLADLAYAKLSHLLAVLGLDLQARHATGLDHALAVAARTASTSCKNALPPETLARMLASGQAPRKMMQHMAGWADELHACRTVGQGHRLKPGQSCSRPSDRNHHPRPPFAIMPRFHPNETSPMTEPFEHEDDAMRTDGAGGERPRSITLKDVARLAGLSPITVSRALHNPKLVRPDTIERVKEAAAAIGYIPNMLAGGLSTRRSRLIAAIVPQLSNSMFAETVQGLNDELAAHGYQLLLSVSSYSKQTEEDLLTGILSRQPDGIVLTGINHHPGVRKKLLTMGVPVVEAWDLTPTPIDIAVGFNHERVGEKVAQYLLDKGYRRFASICGADERAIIRRRAMEAELRRQGVEPLGGHEVSPPTTLALGRAGLQKILDGGLQPEVIVCTSDVLAQGALIEAGARGIAVPGRLGIMGFGDFDFAAHTHPAISTVYVDKRAIGTRAARCLIAKIEGRPFEGQVIDVGFRLIERGTTERPAGQRD